MEHSITNKSVKEYLNIITILDMGPVSDFGQEELRKKRETVRERTKKPVVYFDENSEQLLTYI